MIVAALRALLVFLLLVPLARAGNVALLVSGTDSPYVEFSATLHEALDGTNWKISTPGSVDHIEAAGARPDLIVTAGSDAFRQVLARGGQLPVIATLIPRQNYEKLLAESGSRNRRTSAIWLDQPPARQAAFLRQLLPGKKRIGMLVSNETRSLIPLFSQAFTAAGLSLESEDSDTDATLLPVLNSLLARVNILLATPDSSIYKRNSIKSILITSYRYQRPVVAFSPAFVNAGALAALYSTPAQIARQSAEIIQAHGSTPPPPTSPGQFAILINHNVAQAFGLNIRDEADIRRALLADKETR